MAEGKRPRCTHQTTVRLPQFLDDKLTAMAAARGVTRGKIIRRLITRTRMSTEVVAR